MPTNPSGGTEPKAKPPSAKQIAANRRNAQKSTGPRTPTGRAVSKMNALKHGILSRQVLVESLHYRESRQELETLHQRFWDDLQPDGPVEEMLVDQIVTAHWRLRRALVAESGEIALTVDEGYWKGENGPNMAVRWMQWRDSGLMEEAMQRTWLGNSLLLRWLAEVRRAVEQEGTLTTAAVQAFAGHFDKDSTVAAELEKLHAKQAAQAVEPDAATPRGANKAEALALIDERMEEIRSMRDRCEEHEDFIKQARQATAVLPSSEVLDKIMRYETKLERQMYRAMAQLERVQRMRRGEAIPAPLSVEVSHRR